MIDVERFTTPGRDPCSPATASTMAGPAGRNDGWRSSKIGLHHLQRQAIVYLRQSTPHQMTEHGESLARQYALKDRAVALGWPASDVVLIDQDLGLSGRSSDDRHGFQRLLADVAQNRVGLVLALEMSRLARNSRDWHNLFDLCAVRDVLLADEDGIYDPSDINDRLILGMKGIMSEMELHLMRARLERARRNKAQRGELFHSVPWGYVLLPDGAVALDPDEQVRAAVQRLFDTFERLGTAYSVVRELRRQDVKLPTRDSDDRLAWRHATETIVRTALHHPLYAGAYSWGRRQTQTHVDPTGRMSRSRRHRRPAEWTVLLHDRVPAYITWDQYLANQRLLAENQTRPATKGTPRSGAALLAGLLFCGRCGRKMQVEYRTIRRGRYSCSRQRFAATDEVCGGLPAQGLDELVTQQVLEALSPAAIELSLCAIEHTSQERQQHGTQLRQNLDRATYEVQRAERQYQAVEPENRLVARTLEARWESTLEQQRAAQNAYDRFQDEKPIELAASERRALEELSRDIPELWHAPETTTRERKEIMHCLIERVEVVMSTTEQQVAVVIRWAGGFESRHEQRRPVWAYEQLDDYQQLMTRLGELRRAGWRSPRIAEQLNEEGFQTPKQRGGFTAEVVRGLFPRLASHQQIDDGASLQPPKWTADALAQRLGIPVKKLKDWVRRGWVEAIQRPFDDVWILRADQRELKRLERRVALSRTGCHYPPELDREPISTTRRRRTRGEVAST
jgi:DNA invertase Pin-like site-specific DNA recombinase